MRLRAAIASILLTACSRTEEPTPPPPSGTVTVALAASSHGPSPVDASPPAPSELRIVLAADGGTRAGDQMVGSDQELGALTKRTAASTPDLPIVIDADDQVPYARVVHTMDVVKQSGAARIALATPSSTFPASGGAPTPIPSPSGSTILTMVVVKLDGSGGATVNGKAVSNDDAIADVARDAHRRNPDVQARVEADGKVTQGRVTHVLDGLKAAGITRIAFGAAPRVTVPSP